MSTPELENISGLGLHPVAEDALKRARSHTMKNPMNRARVAIYHVIYHEMAEGIHRHPDEVVSILENVKNEADIFIKLLIE